MSWKRGWRCQPPSRMHVALVGNEGVGAIAGSLNMKYNEYE